MWDSSAKDLRLFPDKKPEDHVVRATRAYDAYLKRIDQDKAEKQMPTGVRIIPDALPPDLCVKLRNILDMTNSTISKDQTSMIADTEILQKLGYLVSDVICDNSVRFWTEIQSNTFYQKIDNRPEDNDIQKQFHMDTFFPAWKFWLFLNDVGENEGCFRYVVHSHTLHAKKLAWMERQYKRFYDGDLTFSEYSKQGSLRIGEDEIEEMYGRDSIVNVRVKANTLVIANVFGFHARGTVSQQTLRTAIHGSIRYENPFI